MNALQIDANGVIVNIIVVESLLFSDGLVDAKIGGNIGDSVINGAVFPKDDAPSYVPQSVPMLNAQLVLIQNGHIAQVNSYIDAMDGVNGDIARAYWKCSTRVHRHNQIVLTMQGVLELSDSDIDELFIAADAIAV